MFPEVAPERAGQATLSSDSMSATMMAAEPNQLHDGTLQPSTSSAPLDDASARALAIQR